MIVHRSRITLILIGLVNFFVMINAPLMTLGVNYAYIAMFSVLILFLLTGNIMLSRLKKFELHFIYMALLFLSLYFTVAFQGGGFNSFISFGLYILPLIVWVVIYSSESSIPYYKIFSSTYPLTIVVAYLGVVQYFLSPNLFGYIPINSMAIKWAIDKPFVEYAEFFRATSTLGSPQVFGFYCAINLILTLRFKRQFSRLSFYLGSIGLLSGGVLTGNKAFFLLVILYLILSNFRKLFFDTKLLSILVVGFVVSIIGYKEIVERVPMLDRVFSITAIVEQENSGSESRLGRYAYILTNSNPVVGEGLGAISNSSNKVLKAPESYFLKIYYEAGAIVMLMFCAVCFISYLRARKVDARDGNIIIVTSLGMVIVHAIESPVFFIIWGYFLSVATFPRKQVKAIYEGK